ncbi:hypothetical protein NA78x_000630 [Anatilimnocola sp. NA78]|uniref:hypothetical protein n=1 Tax=Anatilimnocola sp. NA78 TaxID=3415683 RepID=UPI003CE4B98F
MRERSFFMSAMGSIQPRIFAWDLRAATSLALPLAICLCFSGCGGSGPSTLPVTGVVTLDGQPCEGALVSFVPQETTGGNGGTGLTDSTGKYVTKLQDGKTPGLLPGKYKVMISKFVRPDGSLFVATGDEAPIDSNARELLPPRYSDYQYTTLQAQIDAAATPHNFDLKSKK